MRTRRHLLVALLVTVLSVGSGVWVAQPVADTSPSAAASGESATPGRAPYAVAVLHAWDVRRARAWQSGDLEALRRLYLPGSAAGERDARMLTAWQARGLRVRALRTQLLSVRVRVSRPRRLVLVVTDRVSGVLVTDQGVRTPLPRDRASTRVVSLRVRTGAGRWRVGAVRAQP